MSMHHVRLAEIVRRDSRYPYEAYDFMFLALNHAQKRLGRVPREESDDPGKQYHVSPQELLEGIRDLALREFGLMARTVFKMWGIQRTDDIGAIIFNLVEEKLMSKTDEDSLDDFHEVFDLDKALQEGYRIELDEVE